MKEKLRIDIRKRPAGGPRVDTPGDRARRLCQVSLLEENTLCIKSLTFVIDSILVFRKEEERREWQRWE
jgi:hypothetical protein